MSITDQTNSFGRGYDSCRTSSRGLEGSIGPSASGGASPKVPAFSRLRGRYIVDCLPS